MREKVLAIGNAIRNRKGPAFDDLTPSEVADYIADCIEFVLDPYAALDRTDEKPKDPHGVFDPRPGHD